MTHADRSEADTPTHQPQHPLLQRLMVIMGMRGYAMAVQLASFMLLTRLHSLGEVGIYAAISSLWLFARVVGPMGFDISQLRFVSSLLAEGDAGKAESFDRWALKTVSLGMVGLAMTISLLAWGAESYGILPFPAWCVWVFALGLPPITLIALFSSMIRARGGNFWAQFPELVGFPTLMCSSFAFLLLSDIAILPLTLTFHAMIYWIVVGVYIWRYLALPHVPTEPLEESERATMRAATKHMLFSELLTSIGVRAPVLLVLLVLGAEASGLMETGMRFSLPTTIWLWGINLLMSPQLAASHTTGDMEALQRHYAAGCWLTALPTALFVAFLGLCGEWLLATLLTEDYIPAALPMFLLGLGWFVQSSFGFSARLLLMTGHETLVTRFTGLHALIIFTIFPLAAHFGGLNIACITMVCGLLIRDLGMHIQTERLLGVYSPYFSHKGRQASLTQIQNVWHRIANRRH